MEEQSQFQLYRKQQVRSAKRRRKRNRITAKTRPGQVDWFYGTLGPASPVRRIDPATGQVIEIIPAKQTTR